MNKEIGGYIEFEHYHGNHFHDNAIRLNCARNCLAYLIKVNDIKHIYIPYFLCDSVSAICEKYAIRVSFYNIDEKFLPIFPDSDFTQDWIYIVNYYGQLTNQQISDYAAKYKNLIVDNVQAFFQSPVEHVPTIYTCRKFFGVADGAYLYSDKKLNEDIVVDNSYNRMEFLLGRFEKTANEFYPQYTTNNKFFKDETVKLMSPLTENLMRSFEYERIKKIRTENFEYLHKRFEKINKLEISIPLGAFAYPLYIQNGGEIRKKLQKDQIYIPTLWPYVFEICKESVMEYQLAQNILPIPVDQRYGVEEMEYITKRIMHFGGLL